MQRRETNNKYNYNAMNQKQKNILITVIVIIITMLIFPPFQVINRWGVAYNMGYGWLFSPPTSGMITANVNISMLLIQWMGVLIVGGIACFLTKDLTSSTCPILEPQSSYSRAIIELDAPIIINHEDYGIFVAFIKYPIIFIFGGILFAVALFLLFSALLNFIDYFQIIDIRPFVKMLQTLILLVPILMFPVSGQGYVNFYVRNGLGIIWLFKFIRKLSL